MFYIYRPQPSTGARELAEALNARRFKILSNLMQRVRSGDVIIAWGAELTPPNGVKVLNGAPLRSKFTDAERIKAAGIPTVEVTRTKPADELVPVPDPAVAA